MPTTHPVQDADLDGGGGQNLAFILPAFNEEGSIFHAVQELRTYFPAGVVVVVSDGSIDKTVERAKKAGARVLELPITTGVGTAFETGLRYVLDNYPAQVILRLDGDGQHDPGFCHRLIEPITGERADMTIGSRYTPSSPQSSDFLRRVARQGLSLALYTFTGQWFTDPTSGQWAMHRRVAEFLVGRFPVEYPEPEVLFVLKRFGFRLSDVGVTMRERMSGKSTLLGLRAAHYMFKSALAITIESLRRNSK